MYKQKGSNLIIMKETGEKLEIITKNNSNKNQLLLSKERKQVI